jgi:hypothetical protein
LSGRRVAACRVTRRRIGRRLSSRIRLVVTGGLSLPVAALAIDRLTLRWLPLRWLCVA